METLEETETLRPESRSLRPPIPPKTLEEAEHLILLATQAKEKLLEEHRPRIREEVRELLSRVEVSVDDPAAVASFVTGKKLPGARGSSKSGAKSPVLWDIPDGNGGVLEVRQKGPKPPQYHEAKAAGKLDSYRRRQEDSSLGASDPTPSGMA